MEEILTYVRSNKLVVLLLVVLSLGMGFFLWSQKPQASPAVKTEQVVKTDKPANSTKTAKTNIWVIDIQGAVKNSGVYRVKQGTIVQEALQMAGGLSDNADVKQINQAQRVTDQMQLYVPYKGEKISSNAATNSAKEKVVNINSASVDDFKNVTGVGPKKAEKIVAYREKNGNFNSLHDLTKISGFGEKTVERLKDQLTV